MATEVPKTADAPSGPVDHDAWEEALEYLLQMRAEWKQEGRWGRFGIVFDVSAGVIKKTEFVQVRSKGRGHQHEKPVG
jgi:hypothetical protein